MLSSADTDPYSTYAAAFGSLKGHRHGGANHQVRAMQAEIKENVKNWEDDDEVASYLAKIVNKQAYDGTGLVYGMGHAVYTLSDPRAVIGKRFAEQLAAGTEYEAELNLLKSIERLTPEVFAREKGSTKELCANVDMYSGFIYSMMGIPEDLFTPCSPVPAWPAGPPTASRRLPPASASSAPPTKTPSAAPSPTSRSSGGRDRSRQGWYTR